MDLLCRHSTQECRTKTSKPKKKGTCFINYMSACVSIDFQLSLDTVVGKTGTKYASVPYREIITKKYNQSSKSYFVYYIVSHPFRKKHKKLPIDKNYHDLPHFSQIVRHPCREDSDSFPSSLLLPQLEPGVGQS